MTENGRPSDRRFFLIELQSEECQCGRTKQAGRSFCYKCYSSLPEHMQRDLWRPMGQGYEEAYEAAAAWLN